MSANAAIPKIDLRFQKFSQASVMVLAALAFLTQWFPLVILTAICLGLSAFLPAVSPFRLLYRGVLVPAHILAPKPVEDDPAPHRFAQLIGTIFLVGSAIALYAGAYPLGWTLDLIVFALSGINFTVGFCAGCFVYYHLGRIGLLPPVRYAGGFHWRGV